MRGRVRGDRRRGAKRPKPPSRPASASRDVRIRKGVRVPPGIQLEGQLAVMVREGRLAPGRRIPSTRRMASRLGIHRNTVAAAYRRLDRRGLLEVRHGARARVAGGAGPAVGDDPRPARGVVAAAADPGTARLMAAELRAALTAGVDVGTAVVGAGPADPDRPGVLVVALPGPAARPPTGAASGLPLRARQARRPELERALRRAPPLARVAVLTGCPVLRAAVRCDALRLRGGEVTLRAADPARPRASRSLLQASDLAIADRLAARASCCVPPAPDGPPVTPVRLLSRLTLEEASRGLRRASSDGSRPPPPRGDPLEKIQVVRSRVPDEHREEYLEAWSEWSGQLLPMGIECELLESEEERGSFVEITRFEGGDAAAMADDRLARINDRMERAAAERTGARELYAKRRG